METRWTPAAEAYRTSWRVSRASVPGSRILTVPIPVADTEEFPTPIIWHGEIGVSAKKSDSTHEMCMDAPESRYSGKSTGLFAKREISAEARRMFTVSTQRSLAEALASHGCELPSRIQLAYSPWLVAVITLLMSAMAALTSLGSGLYLMPPIQMVPSSPTFRRVFDVLLVAVTLLRGSRGLMRMASHAVHCCYNCALLAAQRTVAILSGDPVHFPSSCSPSCVSTHAFSFRLLAFIIALHSRPMTSYSALQTASFLCYHLPFPT